MQKSTFILKVFVYILSLQLLLIPYLCAQSEDALNLRMQGYKAQKEGDFQEAIALYKKATVADPTYATPYNDLGVVYEMQNVLDQAERAYLTALQINPNYTGVYSNLASLYEKKGDLQRALAYWEKRATMGNPGDPWVQKAQANISRLKSLVPAQPLSMSVPSAGSQRQRATDLAEMIAREEERRARTTTARSRTRVGGTSAKRLADDAQADIHNYRYQDALDKLYRAKEMTAQEEKVKYLDELIDEARSRKIDHALARATMNADLYKKAKLVEVEDAWFPPVPELEAIEGYRESLASVTKSPARLELEKKARQIIPSINFTEAQLKEVIEFLAVSNDINIVIDETVVPKEETVTIHLKDIPLEEALDIILRTKGLKYRFEENIVWITTQEKLLEEDLVVRVYDVQDLVGKLYDFPSRPFDFRSNLELGEEEEIK